MLKLKYLNINFLEKILSKKKFFLNALKPVYTVFNRKSLYKGLKNLVFIANLKKQRILFIAHGRQSLLWVIHRAIGNSTLHQCYTARRWLNGLLTNYKTCSKQLTKCNDMLIPFRTKTAGTTINRRFKRRFRKIRSTLYYYFGIRKLARLPNIVVTLTKSEYAFDEGGAIGALLIDLSTITQRITTLYE